MCVGGMDDHGATRNARRLRGGVTHEVRDLVRDAFGVDLGDERRTRAVRKRHHVDLEGIEDLLGTAVLIIARHEGPERRRDVNARETSLEFTG